MPFYEYECSSCKHHLEAMQKISDAPLKKCPECGRNTLKRLMSAPAFRLKGGGWYETDFKNDADRKRNLAGEKDEAPKADAAADKSAEKPVEKPAEKPAAKPDDARPAAKTTVPVRKPAAAASRPRAAARKPAARKAAAKSRAGRR